MVVPLPTTPERGQVVAMIMGIVHPSLRLTEQSHFKCRRYFSPFHARPELAAREPRKVNLYSHASPFLLP